MHTPDVFDLTEALRALLEGCNRTDSKPINVAILDLKVDMVAFDIPDRPAYSQLAYRKATKLSGL